MPGEPNSVGLARFAFESDDPAREKGRIIEAIRGFGRTQAWNDAIANEIHLILEEWLTNFNSYALAAIPRPHLCLSLETSKEEATLTITDNGLPFDPTAQREPDFSLPPAERPIGGLGIFMIRKL